MTQNCLVTKLKSTVNIDTLPQLNTIYLDLNEIALRSKCDKFLSNTILFIRTGNASVTIESQGIFKVDSTSTQTTYTTFTINANAYRSLFFENANIPETYVKDFLKITSDDIYSIKIFCEYNSLYFNYNDSLRSNLQVMNYNTDLQLCQYNNEINKYISKNIKGLVVADVNNTAIDGEYIFNNYINLEYLYGSIITSSTAANVLVLSNTTNLYKSLKYTNLRFSGDISKMPINLVRLSGLTSGLIGNLEDYVYKCRLNGRTSGYLVIDSSNDIWEFKYNNTFIKSLSATDKKLTSDRTNAYFYWDSSSMWFSETMPSDPFCIISSPYTYYEYLYSNENII